MNRIYIAALMTVMICASGCGLSERERFEANEKLLSALDKDIKGSAADYIRLLISEGADVNAKDSDGQALQLGGDVVEVLHDLRSGQSHLVSVTGRAVPPRFPSSHTCGPGGLGRCEEGATGWTVAACNR